MKQRGYPRQKPRRKGLPKLVSCHATRQALALAETSTTARMKAEREGLLAVEEASLPSKTKSAPRAGTKKKPPSDTLRPTGAGMSGFGLDDPMGLRKVKGADGEVEEVGELSAVGLEGMLEALEVANARTDRETLGAKVGLPIPCVGCQWLSGLMGHRRVYWWRNILRYAL